MEVSTYLSNTIQEAGHKVRYDTEVKKILADKTILAWIIKETVKIIMNVEAQHQYYPGYDLVTRGLFYCARLLSSQLDNEFSGRNYDEVKKVYSIWICMDTPKHARNTITKYHIQPQKIYGEFSGKARYDILSAVMICLGNDNSENELIGLLETLLSEDLSVSEKQVLLEKKYEIEMSVKVKEGLDQMCNLSDYIEEKAILKGREKGREEGRIEGAIIMAKKSFKRNIAEEEIIADLEEVLKISYEEAKELFEKEIACLEVL